MTDEPDFLTYRRKEFAAAEQACVRARENLKNTAVRHGLPTKGLFSGSLFVWRSSADRWADEAEQKGRELGRQEILDLFEASEGNLVAFTHLANSNFADGSSAAEVAARIIATGKKRRGEV